ncbi:MAG TPA: redoxin domain-containing protein [Pirellulales bacterium]|jgi:peroxiredoxin
MFIRDRLPSLPLLILGVALLAQPLPGRTAEIGAEIKAFALPDMHGRERSLSEFADNQLVVVAFLGTECPLARLYAPRLQEICDEYQARGVAFIGVDSNQQDSLTEISAFAEHYGVKFPLLKDRDQSVADQLGVERNPHVVVLDKNRVIRYSGRVDDQYGLGSSSGYARTKVNRRDLATALDELLSGKEVSERNVKALGCLIHRTTKKAPQGDITFTKHIAALLQTRCVQCHRANEIGPMALTDYDEVVGWADMIREVVSENRMPPWPANPEFGHFANDARLTDEEKQLLFAWVDNGCPHGDPKDLPAPREWTDGWQIPQPDQVVRMGTSFDVPAEGVIPYQYFVVDPNWTEDKWIRAAEARAGNRSVVHHIIVFVIPGGASSMLNTLVDKDGHVNTEMIERLRTARESGARANGSRSETAGSRREGRGGLGAGLAGLEGRGGGLTAYVPGHVPSVYPAGVATFVPKGSKLIFQMHYTANGKAQQDQSYVGVVFADPATVSQRVHGGAVGNRDLTIPPNLNDYVVTGERKLPSEQWLYTMSPHMHVRGKSFRYVAHYPDGTSEVLLDVPHYDFNWQLQYNLAKPKLLPAGTKLVCTAHYDNSNDNLANPNPNDTVHWGPQTWDEMMLGFYSTVSAADDAHSESPSAKQAEPAGEGEE